MTEDIVINFKANMPDELKKGLFEPTIDQKIELLKIASTSDLDIGTRFNDGEKTLAIYKKFIDAVCPDATTDSKKKAT